MNSKDTVRRYMVSDECFEIMTEAMRLRSNSIKKFASLRDVVEHSIQELQKTEFDDTDFHLFISTRTMTGGNPVHLRLTGRVKLALSTLQQKLSEACGLEIYDRTAIAYFLQLYIDKTVLTEKKTA